MSHELQTPLWGSWLLEAQTELPQSSMQPVLPWDLRPIRQHSPTVERLFISCAPLPRAGGEQMGLAGWRRSASDYVLPVNLWADTVFVLLLQASCCPLVLCVPASHVFQVQGCPDALPPNSWDLCDEPGLFHQMHPSPLFTTTPLSNYKSSLSSYNVISNSDSHPFLSPSGRGF